MITIRNSFLHFVTIGIVALMPFGSGSAWAAMIDGTWLTQDGSSHVAFYACGDQWCGKIIWLEEPIDKDTGKPWLDKLNQDSGLRSRPLLGLDILFDLKSTGPDEMKGKLYNPLDGRTYTGKIQRSGSKLSVNGCILSGLICQKERWTLVKDQ